MKNLFYIWSIAFFVISTFYSGSVGAGVYAGWDIIYESSRYPGSHWYGFDGKKVEKIDAVLKERTEEDIMYEEDSATLIVKNGKKWRTYLYGEGIKAGPIKKIEGPCWDRSNLMKYFKSEKRPVVRRCDVNWGKNDLSICYLVKGGLFKYGWQDKKNVAKSLQTCGYSSEDLLRKKIILVDSSIDFTPKKKWSWSDRHYGRESTHTLFLRGKEGSLVKLGGAHNFNLKLYDFDRDSTPDIIYEYNMIEGDGTKIYLSSFHSPKTKKKSKNKSDAKIKEKKQLIINRSRIKRR